METKYLDNQSCRELAYICEMSYLDSEVNIHANLKDVDKQYNSVKIVEVDNFAALVVSHNSFLVVAFRGPDDIRSWLANIQTNSTNKFEPCLGMCGNFQIDFYGAAQTIYASVTKAIDQYIKKKETPVYITGHSLGGAIANVFAVEMLNRQRIDYVGFERLVTFGAPRVAERETAKAMNRLFLENHYRVAHCLDPVPQVPTKFRFQHAGKLVYINRRGVPMFGSTMLYRLYDGRAFDSLMGGVGRQDPLKSHEIQSYVRAFEN